MIPFMKYDGIMHEYHDESLLYGMTNVNDEYVHSNCISWIINGYS